MRRIAVEEHFYTSEFLKYLRSRKDYPRREIVEDQEHGRIEVIWYAPCCSWTMNNPDAGARLITDTGEVRLGIMDRAGISKQVVSLGAPGVEVFDATEGKMWAQQTNDELARTVKRYPERFAGFAALPMQAPDAAADELERAVRKLGLSGALVNSNVQGEYLDERKFWVVFERAQQLGVPIYIHPREPSPDMIKPYLAYPALWSALWGYGAEVGLHALRLICSGVFDEYPRLKIIIGHMGEALPFWLWRIDNKWRATPMSKTLKRKPSEYFRDNFLMTTSGMSSWPALQCAHTALGADNILFAVDYPFESSEEAVQFMDSAPLPGTDKEKIYHLNAEKLLKV